MRREFDVWIGCLVAGIHADVTGRGKVAARVDQIADFSCCRPHRHIAPRFPVDSP
jgi:hypothetical protein